MKKNPPPSPLPNTVALVPSTPSSTQGDKTDKKANIRAEKEQYNNRVLALRITFDSKTNNVTLLELSEFIPSIQDATSKSNQCKTTEVALHSIAKTMNTSSHYIARAIDPLVFDKIPVAQVGQAKWSATVVTSLTENSSAGLTVPQMMPDTQSTAKAKKEQEDVNDAGETLGKHTTK